MLDAILRNVLIKRAGETTVAAARAGLQQQSSHPSTLASYRRARFSQPELLQGRPAARRRKRRLSEAVVVFAVPIQWPTLLEMD